jgi:DNA replication protein DnaC
MPDELIADRLSANLKRLRLPRIHAVLLDVVHSAEQQSHSYLQMLDTLIQEEVVCKEQRRLDTVLRISGLPYIKTIDEYDFPFQPGLDRRQVMSLFDLTFLDRCENVFFLGPPGGRQNTPGRRSGCEVLSGREVHLLHNHGRSH